MTEPIAWTTAGPVRGREKEGVLLFAGIPYAAPPTGPRRFRPPEPPTPWAAVLDTTRFGPVSWQEGQTLGGIVAGGPAPNCDEDCLFLNVQTPELDDRDRPVMVWIHGGAFTSGTGATPWYNGARFVHHGDVVTVTINYRLGALGFLHLAELGGAAYASTGLLGILDQVAALEWVRDNIAAFGGDPGNVTVFGESAGGMSVATLLGLPRSRGLFRRAIAQSGAAQNVRSAASAAEVTRRFCELGGFADLDALLRADPAHLLDTQVRLTAALRSRAERRAADDGTDAPVDGAGLGLPFQPVVDGVELPSPPIDAVRAGSARDVTVMCGTTRDEWNLFALADPSPPDAAALERRMANLFGGRGPGLLAGYLEARPHASPSELFAAVMTDAVFRIPAIRLAEAQARHRPDDTRMYLFTWASPALGGALGSAHALEIPFVFDNLDRAGVGFVTGDGPPQSLATAMHLSWLGFARSGDPTHEGTGPWPAYEPSGRRATLEFGDVVGVVDDPGRAERQLWERFS